MARDPKAEIEISAHSRTLGARLREARAKFGNFGAEVKKELLSGSFFGKSAAEAAGTLGANAFGKVGGFLADQAKDAYAYQDALNRLQIAANGTPEQIAAMDVAIRSASDATGIGKAQTLAAARQYVALTGDLDGATKSIGTWARVAQASDSSISDVASTAQALRDNLKLDPSQMQAAFDVIIGQGKSGAVEMSELRNQLAVVSPLMAQFGGGASLQGLADLGATVQIVRKGFGGTEETITGVQSLMTALIKNAKQLHRAGVDVYDKDPKTGALHLKSFRAEIDAILGSQLMKDPTKLEKAFGRVEAYRAFLQLKDNRAEFDRLADAAQYAGTTQRDLAAYTESATGRVKIAMEQAKNKIAEAFTPERIETFANAIVALTRGVAGLIDALGALGSSMDPIGTAQKMLGQELVERNAGLTFEGKQAKAQEYMRKAQSLDADDRNREAYEYAAGELSKQSDRWRGDGSASLDANRASKAIAAFSLRANPVVQAVDQSLANINRAGGIGSDSIALKILDELKKLNANTAKQPVHVNVDGNRLVDAHRNASNHARRPGG
jgi:TP901 family phage tail tape measure protein